MPKAEGKGSEQPSENAYTGKADSHVPVFSNLQKDYREYRKRAELYKKKMELAGRQQEVVFNLVTLMTGRAWDLVDDMEMADLQKEDALDKVFARLDSAFKPDLVTELRGFLREAAAESRPFRSIRPSSVGWSAGFGRRIRWSCRRRSKPGGSCGGVASAGAAPDGHDADRH